MKGFGVGLAIVLGLAAAPGCKCSTARPTGAAASASASADGRHLAPRLAKRLAAGIERATKHIASRIDTFDPRLAMILAYPQRKFAPPGLPSMAARAQSEDADPGMKHFVQLFRRLYDGKASVDRQSIEVEPSEIDRMTGLALYCDRFGKPETLLPLLTTMTERTDEYSLPHAMMATGWATENGCIAPDLAKLLHDRQAELVEQRMAHQTSSRVSDALIESIVFLYYLDEQSHVKDEWIEAVLDAQLPGGGWSNLTENEEEHTTAMAYWLLLEALHRDAPPTPWIPRE